MRLRQPLFLVGFSGSGKSTVGPGLAKRLNCKFSDIDSIITRQERRTITEIFESDGEKYFRSIEKDTISDICSKSGAGSIVALGGGAFENQESRQKVFGLGYVVWLRCSQREIYNRLKTRTDRPMLSKRSTRGLSDSQLIKDNIRRLMRKRIGNYRKANITVSTTGKRVTETIREVISKLKANNVIT